MKRSFVFASVAITVALSGFSANASSYRITQHDAEIGYCGYLLYNQATTAYNLGYLDHGTKQFYLRTGASTLNYIQSKYSMSDKQLAGVLKQLAKQNRHGQSAKYDAKYISYCLKKLKL